MSELPFQDSEYSSLHRYAYEKVRSGLAFLLSHFGEPLWPRKILTHSCYLQVKVPSEKQALSRFARAKFQDCFINAYPIGDYVGLPSKTQNRASIVEVIRGHIRGHIKVYKFRSRNTVSMKKSP